MLRFYLFLHFFFLQDAFQQRGKNFALLLVTVTATVQSVLSLMSVFHTVIVCLMVDWICLHYFNMEDGFHRGCVRAVTPVQASVQHTLLP